MKIRHLHQWSVTVEQAQELQRRLAPQVSRRDEIGTVSFIAGVDISAPDIHRVAKGAVVVVSYPELEVVDKEVVEDRVEFPYVPGLLSFRESPLIVKALEALSTTPDLLLVDGQGLAHPRRFGLACHLGLLTDIPTIGCAKSILVGKHGLLAEEVGFHAELVDRGEVVGAALRTKTKTNPIYASIGHKVDLEAAIHWTLACCRGYRMPEPTRLAHLAAGGQLKEMPSRAERGVQGQLPL
ncbi:MAG: deoxyribonuclease V [Dehalococcoidia bacterium]